VTAGELVFLVLGLGLGIVSGAAIVEVLRTRPPVPRQVRVTVQADAIPRRRAATLAIDAFAMPGFETAPGGPADRRIDELPVPAGGLERRTTVRSGSGVPVFAPLVGIPVAGGDDPVLAALRVQAVSSAMRGGNGHGNGNGNGHGHAADPLPRTTDGGGPG
jgi:hypothetical protein